MRTPTFSATELPQLQRQLQAWRQRQSGRRHLPATLWDAAAQLAHRYGVSRVAQVLHLDYYRLQRRAQVPTPAVASSRPPAPFVELKLDSPPLRPVNIGSVELFDGSQRRLRIETGPDPAAWIALAEAFWKTRP